MGGYRRFAGMKGVPDILAVIPPDGRLLGVECNAARGRMTADQEHFRLRLTMEGGIYVVARSVGELIDALEVQAADPRD